jgi:hypothetical protein
MLACSDDAPRERVGEPVTERPRDAGRSGPTGVDAGPDEAQDPPETQGPDAAEPASGESDSQLTLRADVAPVTRAEDALPRVFIPPFEQCTTAKAGEVGAGPEGKVCTNVAISGSTEAGKYFPDYGACDVVMTQRPYWPAPPARASRSDDPRLSDASYLAEVAWVTEQVETTGCVCCHDARAMPEGMGPSQWDIALGPLWLDSLSDTGLSLFAGLADSTSLGAYRPEDNNGFDRNVVGIPTDDNARMERFMRAELQRRGISEDEARAVPPFGGPIYANRVQKPDPCAAGEGVEPGGAIRWNGGPARYVYVLEPGTENPGVPPNLDLPAGTVFRLDVLASREPVASGLPYGTTPAGSFQAFPETGRAGALVAGETYQLYVLADVGLPRANCLFEFGREIAIATPPEPRDAGTAPSSDASASCTSVGGDREGFGAPCKDGANHSDCPCAADYCAVQPGQTTGYCTKTGCVEDPNICPSGYTCFDLSKFAPDLPAFCSK